MSNMMEKENQQSDNYQIIGDNMILKYSMPSSKNEDSLQKVALMDNLLKNVQIHNEKVDKFIISEKKHIQNLQNGYYDKVFEEKGNTKEGLHPKAAVQKYLDNQSKELDKHQSAISSHFNKNFSNDQPSIRFEVFIVPKEELKNLQKNIESKRDNLKDFLSQNKLEQKSIENKDILQTIVKDTTGKAPAVKENSKDITFSYKIIGDQMILKYSDSSPKNQSLENLFEKVATHNKKVEQLVKFQKQHQENIKSGNYDKLFNEKGLSAEGMHPKEAAQKTLDTESESLKKEGIQIEELLEKKHEKSDVSLKGEAYYISQEMLQDLKKHLENGGTLERFVAEKNIEPTKLENRQAVMEVVNTTSKKDISNDKTQPEQKSQDSLHIENNPGKAEASTKTDNNPDKAKDTVTKDPNKNPKLDEKYTLNTNSDEIHKDISESHEAVKGVYGYENYFFNKTETTNITEKSTKDISTKKGEPQIAQKKSSSLTIDKHDAQNKAAQKESHNTKAVAIANYDSIVQEIKENYLSLPLSERRKMKEAAISHAIANGTPILRPTRLNAMAEPSKDAMTKQRLDMRKI